MKTETEDKKLSFEVTFDKQIQSTKVCEPEFLVDKLITRRGITIIGGFWKSYKTYIALHLAYCVASGTPFLGKYKVTKEPVFYIDQENGQVRIIQRAKRIRNGIKIQEEKIQLGIAHFPGIYLTNRTIIESRLLPLIKKYKPKLLIFDSGISFLEGNENDSVTIRKIGNNLTPLIEEYDLDVAILHHTDKSEGHKRARNLRGSGDWCAIATTVLMLEREETTGLCILSHELSRDTATLPNAIIIRPDFSDNQVKFEYIGESTQDNKVSKKTLAKMDIKELITQGKVKAEFKSGQIKGLIGEQHNNNQIVEALKELEQEKLIKSTGRGLWKILFNSLKGKELLNKTLHSEREIKISPL